MMVIVRTLTHKKGKGETMGRDFLHTLYNSNTNELTNKGFVFAMVAVHVVLVGATILIFS